MNETPGTFELLEPVSPEALVPDPWLAPWMLVVVVLLALVAIAVLVFRKKKVPAPDPVALRRVAREDATAALNAIGPVPAREAAVRASLILRRYLSVAAEDPALFETQEEFIARHESLKDFAEDARESANTGFARLAAIKYSPTTPDLSTGEVIAGSQLLLEILHLGFRA